MIADNPRVVFQMIEEIDHQRAVCAQTDIGALIDVADVDQERVSILPAPAFDLRSAARDPAEVAVPEIIARRQDMSVEIGRVNDRDLNRFTVRGDGAGESRRGAKQTRAANCFEERAARGGTHASLVSRNARARQFYSCKTGSVIDVEGIDHVALSVRDVERSAQWYIDVLGFERRHEGMWDGIPVFIGKGSTSIALFPDRSKEGSTSSSRGGGVRILHLALRANRKNFLAAQEELKRHGIKFEFQDHEISHSIYFQDPDGHKLEITTYELKSAL